MCTDVLPVNIIMPYQPSITSVVLTIFIIAAFSLRLWWKRREVAASDGRSHEPVSGRVLHSATRRARRDADEHSTTSSLSSSFAQETLFLQNCRQEENEPSKHQMENRKTRTESCHPSSRPLPPLSTTAEAITEPSLPSEWLRSSLLNGGTLLRKIWDAVTRCAPARFLIERKQMEEERAREFLDGLFTALRVWRMPFATLLFHPFYLHNHAQQTYLSHRSRRQSHQHARSESWTQDLLSDLSDVDGEEREVELEQEELWGLLEGIERRRRALTGRNLFRQPLPPRRQRRLSRARDSAHIVDEVPQDDLQLYDDASNAVEIPTLAAGVPLRFSTDRRARPMLTDRRGRWVPVAVMDEDGEYYNYNLDQIVSRD